MPGENAHEQVGFLLPQLGRDPAAVAVRAEELGYDSVWLGELWYTASPVKLAQIVERTSEVDVGSAILNTYSRTPAVLAMTAATLQRDSGGRFHLGLGTSTPKAVEDLHGMDFDDPNPARRMHECVELVREFLTGAGRADYDGQVFHAADFPALGSDVLIYGAALGQANRRVVARLCDGWIPHNVPFPDLDDAFDYIREHTPDDRDADDISVAPYVPAAVHEDPDEARDAIRGHVAYYVGNGDGYKRAVGTRFPEGADAVAEAWREGERAAARDAVTDEMVDALGIAGSPETAREQFDDLCETAVMDRPLVTIPQDASGMLDATIEALAPENR
jgi:alkanesulfonate monooxygenase SsuD/methylene tetrahydromethanopterin reductase-like flavin-dependent oxidoreductase (luciferase family)